MRPPSELHLERRMLRVLTRRDGLRFRKKCVSLPQTGPPQISD
ncbi:Protein of unknown function [Pyronema omphalodes CBS 100304]|uniref:Uncharacterized protein n=1 Tax=Pyronema omphalodes (strain CBS 100304) TaxID=1076935 RepID=U4LJ32_PYROM|nr:Protein of unknown function [Pyronema omphalodes CBS 100304]